VGRQLAGLRLWIGANAVPVVLVPLAAVLLWVAIWKVWLPEPGPGTPSRRSVTLAVALVLLGVASALVGLFHDRIGSIKVSTTGIDVELSKAEQAGAQELVSALAARNAPAGAYVEGLQRYVSQVRNGHTAVLGAVEQPDAQYKELARRIAADLAPG
jgi:hypothetical protein